MFLTSMDLKTVFSVQSLWENRAHVEGWHGFSIDTNFPKKRLVLYADPKAAVEPVQRIAKLLTGSLPVEVLPLPRFRYCGASTPPSASPQLGDGVFAINKICKRGTTGSIGGFLKYSDHKDGDPLLILSASHVLRRKPEAGQMIPRLTWTGAPRPSARSFTRRRHPDKRNKPRGRGDRRNKHCRRAESVPGNRTGFL